MRNWLCRMLKRGQRLHFPSNILESVKNLMITLTFQFFVEYKGGDLGEMTATSNCRPLDSFSFIDL